MHRLRKTDLAELLIVLARRNDKTGGRFREIERSIPGITTRMLSKELKEMEQSKLLKRTVYDETPVLVEYAPTEHCRSFGKVIAEMIRWGKGHREVVIRGNRVK